MDLSFMASYTVPVVVGVCLCVGFVIKHVLPGEAINRFIPVIMAVLGVLMNIWIAGAMDPDVLLGGMFSGLASTGLYEAFKNLLEEESA